MNNGQMNIVPMQTVMQPVTQDSSLPVAVTMDGDEQNAGIFAGMLNGIQHVTKGTGMPDSGQTEQLSAKTGKHQRHLDVGAEGQIVDLLAQFQVSPDIIPVSEPADSKTAELSKPDISTNAAVPARSEPSDSASQMALVAYLQTEKMPGVNIPAPLSVDGTQNVAAVAGQPAVISALQLGSAEESAPAGLPQPAASGRTPEVNKPTPLLVDGLQNAVTVPTQPAVKIQPEQTAVAVKILPEQTAVRSLQVSQVTTPVLGFAKESTPVSSPQPSASGTMPVQLVFAHELAPAASPQPSTSDRMSEINKPSPLPVSPLQNVASATDQQALVSALSDKMQVAQTVAVPSQSPVPLTAATGSAPAPDENIVARVTRTTELSASPAEKTAAPSIAPQSELPSAHPDKPASIVSPETDVEIQLSQPQPITAQITAALAVAGNRSTATAQETRTGKQRFTNEQQIENVRTDNEPGSAKEMVSSLHSAESASESSLGSDTQHGSTSNQEHPDAVSDNQVLAQQMRGQLSTEHQKVAALPTKMVAAEPARQDISGQVMSQVKDRLEQHDVKPGNQQITLTLSPDSLGELKMNLNLQGQKLSVEIVTDNRTVRDAIAQHTGALKESLARQNITMESFDVTSGGKGSGNQGQGQNQNAWRELAKQQQQQQAWTSPRGYQTAQADLPSGQATYQRQQGQSMLDIHY